MADNYVISQILLGQGIIAEGLGSIENTYYNSYWLFS